MKGKVLPSIFKMALRNSSSFFSVDFLVATFVGLKSIDDSSDGTLFIMSQTNLAQLEVRCDFHPSREWIVSASL